MQPTAQPAPASSSWHLTTLLAMDLPDVCRLDYHFVEEPTDATAPFLATGPMLMLESVFPDAQSPAGMVYDEPLGHVVLTPLGPVLRLEYGVYSGNIGIAGGTETIFGKPTTLIAIGATDLKPVEQ